MSAGWAHCLARSADGRVFSWGDNEFGQLGHMSAAPIAMPSEVDFGVATDFDGRVGDVASSSQSRFSCAVSTEGRAYLWGTVPCCEPTRPLPALSVAPLVRSLRVLCVVHPLCHVAGKNEWRQLAVRPCEYTAESLTSPRPTDPVELTSPSTGERLRVVAISLGADNGACVCDDGSVWTWGRKRYGKSGADDPVFEEHPHPINDLRELPALSDLTGDRHWDRYFNERPMRLPTFGPLATQRTALAVECGGNHVMVHVDTSLCAV